MEEMNDEIGGFGGLESEYRWERGGQQSHHAYCWSTIKSALPTCGPMNVLDAGCGPGFIAAQLARLGHRVTGIDSSPAGIRLARIAYPDVRFEVRSVYDKLMDLTPDTGWDLVLNVEVIEHLFSPRRFLENVRCYISDGGRLIVSTPYHGYMKNLAISVANGWDRHHTVDWACGHIKFFSRRTLAKALASEGFEPVLFRYSGRLPLLWKSMVCVAVKRS